MGRILLAGVAAGLVVFLWGALAHTLLPLGMVGMKVPADAAQQSALTSMQAFGEEGVYLLPMPPKEQWEDEAAMKAFGASAAQRPYAFVVFQPQGRDTMAGFGGMLAWQAASNIAAGVLAAFIAASVGGSRMRRVMVVSALGLFAWLALAVPYWNWYRFPADFTCAALAEQFVGWVLGGVAIAFVLKPRP